MVSDILTFKRNQNDDKAKDILPLEYRDLKGRVTTAMPSPGAFIQIDYNIMSYKITIQGDTSIGVRYIPSMIRNLSDDDMPLASPSKRKKVVKL